MPRKVRLKTAETLFTNTYKTKEQTHMVFSEVTPEGAMRPTDEQVVVRGEQIGRSENALNIDLPELMTPERILGKVLLETIKRNNGEITSEKMKENIQGLLTQDIYISTGGKPETETQPISDKPNEETSREITYTPCYVRPAIEFLLLSNNIDFFKFQLTHFFKNENEKDVHTALVSAMSIIKLEENESIDFSDANLTGANFNGAKLGQSNFEGAILKDAIFTSADLSQCNITQNQLDEMVTYEDAKIPQGYWPYWNNQAKGELFERLQALETYARKHIVDENDPKRKEVERISQTYHNTIASSEKRLTGAFREQMLIDLTKPETQTIFAQHRNLRFLLGEIISFIALAGVFYLAIAAYNYKQTKHFGLFAQPKTEKLSNEITQQLRFGL